jgi:hypothetical protein
MAALGSPQLYRLVNGRNSGFWWVILAQKEEKRLHLYLDMKLLGETRLAFKIDEQNSLTKTATFLPLSVYGRLYWNAALPFHGFILIGMTNKIAGGG